MRSPRCSTPPTAYTPYATEPPVIRIIYVWFVESSGDELPVVMLMGDKTLLGNRWYPSKVVQVETQMIRQWEAEHPGYAARVKRTR